MPPKVKVAKEDIIKTAITIAREKGAHSVNARAIATMLNCSTQPVFSNFDSMEQLQDAILSTAFEIYLKFLETEAQKDKYPRYKAFGMAYIRFAMEEKELFKLLFMRDRKGEEFIPTPDFNESIEMIMNANGITRERAELIHLEMWGFVHGIASMFATSFLSLEWELVSDMVTDIYQGVRSRHLTEGK